MDTSSSPCDGQEVDIPNDLPEEITMDILSRLPVKSLKMFETVSKSWFKMIRNQQFGELQLSEAEKNVKLIAVSPPLARYSSVDVQVIEEEESGLRFSELRVFNMPETSLIMNSCRGLMCLVNFHPFGSVDIWNPSTKEHITLPVDEEPRHPHKIIVNTVAGMGYNPTIQKFKVIRIFEVSKNYFYEEGKDGINTLVMKIHSVGTNTWRMRGKIRDAYIYDEYRYEPLQITGSYLHWIIMRREERRICILSINIKSERVRVTPIPVFFDDPFQKVGMANLSGRLAVYCCIRNHFHVSVMGRSRFIWFSSFRIPYINPLDSFKLQEGILHGTDIEDVYIIDDGEHFVAYDARNHKWEFISHHPSTYSLVFRHVDSVISPKSLLPGDRH